MYPSSRCHGDQLVVAFCCLGDLISLFLRGRLFVIKRPLSETVAKLICFAGHLEAETLYNNKRSAAQFVSLLHRFLFLFFWKHSKTTENKKKGNCVRGKLRSAGRRVQGRPRTVYLFCRTDNSLLLLAYNLPKAGKKKVNNNWNAVGSPGCGRRKSSARLLTNNREKKSMSRATSSLFSFFFLFLFCLSHPASDDQRRFIDADFPPKVDSCNFIAPLSLRYGYVCGSRVE